MKRLMVTRMVLNLESKKATKKRKRKKRKKRKKRWSLGR
jgi:hypothetical protein